MNRFSLPLIMLTAVCLVAATLSPSQAATLKHTWVASFGDNSNTCDISAPCATFAGAYNKTDVGGEITCINSGNYSQVVISHSLSINCENAIGGNGIPLGAFNIIVTPGADDYVILRGLDFDGTGTTIGGGQIDIGGAGVVHLQKIKINNWRGSGSGVNFTPNGPAKLFISDCFITDNGSSGNAAGIYIKPSSGVQADVTIDRTRIENNFFGIVADGTGGGSIRGLVSDSVVSGNVNNGITVTTSGPSVVFSIDRTAVTHNKYGLVAAGGAGMLVGNSTIAHNTTGLLAAFGGVLLSYKNNNLNANTTNDGVFSGVVGQQ